MTSQKYAGITITEFVLLIAIIVVVALIGIPQLSTFLSKVESATTTAVASSLTASNASNYIMSKTNSASIPIKNCTDVANILKSGLPSAYTITSAEVPANTSVTCTLTGPYSTKATFNATGV